MPKIKLTQGKFLILDQKDYSEMVDKSIHLSQSRNRFYARILTADRKRIYVHRFVSKCPEGYQVDHINGDTLDNRRSNLRICTNAENNRNKPMHSDNKSGYKGVYFFPWGKRTNRWCSRISTAGKSVLLGYFPTAYAAAGAYDLAAIRLHGKYALLNFPKKIRKKSFTLSGKAR